MQDNFTDLLKIGIKRIRSELLLFSIVVIIFIIFFNQFRYWIGGVYILGMIGFVGLEIVKLKRAPEQLEISKKPEIIVYTTDKEGYFLLEFYNSGNEDIIDFESKIFWQDKKGRKERKLKFIDENERPLWAHSRECKIIRKGEKNMQQIFPGIHYMVRFWSE